MLGHLFYRIVFQMVASPGVKQGLWELVAGIFVSEDIVVDRIKCKIKDCPVLNKQSWPQLPCGNGHMEGGRGKIE